MNLVGLDVNATRARAVLGPAGIAPHALPLDETRRDLPLALSLQHRALDLGRAGVALSRELPHLVCENFLPRLGTPHEWAAGRHRLDAARALTLVFERLRTPCAPAKGVVLALPPYITREQGELLAPLAAKARLPLLGSVPASIAAALAVYKTAPWSGLAVVVDADEHALTFSVLASAPGASADEDEDERGKAETPAHTFTFIHAQSHTLPRLGIQTWKARLIDGVADRCVRHSRRDPRDSGAAEQMLYDQLDEVFDACRQDQMVEMVVQGTHWCQNLILRPEDVRAMCAAQVQQAADKLREVFTTADGDGVKRVLVTASAWRLPGLREALQDETGELPLTQLPADAACVGAHELAAHFHRGDLPREHLDAVVRCPLNVAPAPKPPERKRRLFRF